MLNLRAYLAVVDADASLSVEVHRELGALTDSWKVWQERGAKALIDVGFSRVSDAEILRILDGHETRVLLSRPARDVFARMGKCALRQADQSLEGIPYYVAVSGWGYEIEDPAPAEGGDEHCAQTLHDRVANDGFREEGAFGGELSLPLGGTAEDLISLAGIVPDWAADLEVGDERIAMSSSNQLSRRGIRSLRALANTSPRFVEQIPWMGPARISAACDSVRNLIFAERANTHPILGRTDPLVKEGLGAEEASGLPQHQMSAGSLLADFDSWLRTLDARDRAILTARTGREGAPATFDAIAETVGLTRERVRQITSRKLAIWAGKFEGASPWIELVDWTNTSREAPWLEAAARELDWLHGAGLLPDFVKSMLDCFSGIGLNVVEIDGRFAVTTFNQQDWHREGAVFHRLIRAAVDDAMPVDLLRAALIGAASDFAGSSPTWVADLLLSEVIVAQPVSSPAVVVGPTATGESIVRKVLVESVTPLHFSEIYRRALEQGFEIELRRAHSAATAVGYLFDRGTYGTLTHTGLPTAELDEYRRMVEQIISNASPDRQWHSQDLFALVEPPIGSLAGEYLVDIVLEDSNVVVDLGRRVWASGLGSHRSTADRIDQQQAVESLLLAAGAPMTTKAIQAELKAHRGVGKNFQIHEAGKLVRIGVSQWGLINRDVPLSDDQVQEYLANLDRHLTTTRQGVHKTELAALVPRILGSDSTLPGEMLMSVATRTGDFRGTQSDYVILPDWDSHNRMTVADVVASVLANRPASTSDLLEHARESVGLEMPMYSVHSALKHLGAVFDQSTNTWSLQPLS